METTPNHFHILLIDDDEFERKVFKRTLSYVSIQATLHEAWDLQSALQVLSNQNIDCIFLDYRLDGITAFDILKGLQEAGQTSSVAITTSLKDEGIAIELLKLGAIDYVNKSELTPDKIENIILSASKIRMYESQKIRAEQELKNQVAKLEAILESSSSAILSINSDWTITGFNSSAKDLFKRFFGLELIENFTLKSHPDMLANVPLAVQGLTDALQGNRVQVEQVRLADRFAEYFFELAFNPIIDEHGQTKGVAVFIQDITEKKRNEEALLKARNEALQAAQAKSDFLSNMSHEIRTPMNAIIGITDLLLDKLALPENREYLQSIKYSADNLLHIINDILDLSKIEAGKVELESIAFNLPQRMHELKKTFQPRADEKGLDLLITVNQDVPVHLKGDPFRLNQILLNLVSNALKFTHKGSISVLAELKKKTAQHHTILFSVTDTGIGIPSEKIDKIFETFTQAYTDTTRKFGGTGLGLAISKNLVELQQGFMGLKSELGKGSTFFFEIPYTIPNDAEVSIVEVQTTAIQLQDNTYNNNASLKGARILLAEDNSLNQFVAKQLLKKWNAEVSVAETGKEALKSLQELEFDVVLMDLQMPEMNGFEATAEIRGGNHKNINAAIPIIALTADAFDETRKKVLDAGMNDFITKPFKQDDLFTKILVHIKR